jgi:predicted PurR-regulated permease PerM
MKKVLLFVWASLLAVGLPMLLIWAAHQATVLTMGTPVVPSSLTIPPILDSGERWYNPFSWGLDEAAAFATQQATYAANAAANAATSTVGSWTAGVFMRNGILLALAAGLFLVLSFTPFFLSKRETLKQYWNGVDPKFEETSAPITAVQLPPSEKDLADAVSTPVAPANRHPRAKAEKAEV